MDTGIMSSEWFILLQRILTLVASYALLYWTVKSFKQRIRIKINEFADVVLVAVASYWAVYATWAILVYGGADLPSYTFYIFDMKFGLLLTLVSLTALVKDRLLLTQIYDVVYSLALDETEENEEEDKNEQLVA